MVFNVLVKEGECVAVKASKVFSECICECFSVVSSQCDFGWILGSMVFLWTQN